MLLLPHAHRRSIPGDRRLARVFARSAAASTGLLSYGPLRLACALGRSGQAAIKREGDGATPIGIWPIRGVFYRADRVGRPRCVQPVRATRRRDAWCDVAGDGNYNRLVRLPYASIDEQLWRDDHLYDICVVLGFNDLPRVQGRGSAIFMHVVRPGYAPTAGCIALAREDLERLLAMRPAPLAVSFEG